MKKGPIAIGVFAFAGLVGLGGCSHSCVPPGWYQAKATPPLTRPPNAPSIAKDASYEIPGGAPKGRASHDEACLVAPPHVQSSAAPAAAGGTRGTAAKAGG